MAEKPVAIRIARPWDTEEELLRNELETLTRTGVTLVGAQQRPDGVVLRFEVTLRAGAPVLRGEGRVVGYKPNALGAEPGLMLRFTRLDSKSKAFVDRAAALRDGKRPSLMPPPPPKPADSGPKLEDKVEENDIPKAPSAPKLESVYADSGPKLESAEMEATAPVSSGEVRAALAADAADAESRAPDSIEPASEDPAAVPAPPAPPTEVNVAQAAEPTRSAGGPVQAGRAIDTPADRDAILERLRARGRALSTERVASILKRA